MLISFTYSIPSREKTTVFLYHDIIFYSKSYRKTWLKSVGSPHSKITKAVFTNEKEISEFDYKSFSVKGY